MIGARKTPSEFMELSKECAECKIFHGRMTHPLTMVMKMAPRRMLIHLGKRPARSLAPDTTLAEMLTPIVV
jgi:hypothetical protein